MSCRKIIWWKDVSKKWKNFFYLTHGIVSLNKMAGTAILNDVK